MDKKTIKRIGMTIKRADQKRAYNYGDTQATRDALDYCSRVYHAATNAEKYEIGKIATKRPNIWQRAQHRRDQNAENRD